MSGSTRRKITIRQSSRSMDPIRRLYQLQQQYDIDSGEFLFPTAEDNSTVVGWSYTGFGVRRSLFGRTFTDDSPVPTEVPRDEVYPVEETIGLLDMWQDSINRQTPPEFLENPTVDSVDFYDRIGGSLFFDLASYNTPIYYARALSDMVYDSLVIRGEEVDEIRELDGSTPTSVRRLNDMLAVAGAGLFQRQQGVEEYEDVSDLNLFILDHIVKRNPTGGFRASIQGRAYRTTQEANTVLGRIFPPVDGEPSLENKSTDVYQRATGYLPDGQTLGDFILEIIDEKYGEDSINYRLAVQAAILGNICAFIF